MKLHKRFLMTLPFIVVGFGFYKLSNPDAVCNGPISAIVMLISFGLLLLTGILAAIATLQKGQFDKPTPEPITLSISMITLLFIIYGITIRGHIKGEIWIEAENRNLNDWQESKWLTLRKNGNFTFSPNADCAFSGEFRKAGDAIILDKNTIDNDEISSVYLLKSNELVPLFDTTSKIMFTVIEIR